MHSRVVNSQGDHSRFMLRLPNRGVREDGTARQVALGLPSRRRNSWSRLLTPLNMIRDRKRQKLSPKFLVEGQNREPAPPTIVDAGGQDDSPNKTYARKQMLPYRGVAVEHPHDSSVT